MMKCRINCVNNYVIYRLMINDDSYEYPNVYVGSAYCLLMNSIFFKCSNCCILSTEF